MKIKTSLPDAPEFKLLTSLYQAAQTNRATANAELERFRQQLELTAGCPILVNRGFKGVENNGTRRFVAAEASQAAHYLIDLRPIEPPIEAYTLACQLILIQMAIEDTAAGEPAIFSPVTSRIRPQIPLEQSASLAEQRKLARELGECLVLLPQYMFVEARLREQFPVLAPAQKYHALNLEFGRAITVHNHHLPKNGGMARWNRAYAGLCGAFALHWDHLLPDLKLADFYRQLPTWPLSQRIHAAYQRHQADPRPGAVSRCITDVCALVGFPDAVRRQHGPDLAGKSEVGGLELS